jgi:hypothetical protein
MRTDTTPESRYSWWHVSRRLRKRRAGSSAVSKVREPAQLDREQDRDPRTLNNLGPHDHWPLSRSPQQQGIDCLLELSAQSMHDSGRWCNTRSAKSLVMRSGAEVQLSIAVTAMPSELARIDEHDVVRPRVRGLVKSRVGRSLLSNFPGSLDIACSRARAGRRTMSKRHLRRRLDLGRTATRRLAAVLDAEGNCFEPRRWRWTRPWRLGRGWGIDDSIDLYDDIEAVEEYLAIQASHPVIAHGRRIASREHDARAPSRWRARIGWLGNAFVIPVAVLLTAALITAWVAKQHDAKGSTRGTDPPGCRTSGRQAAQSPVPLPTPGSGVHLMLMRSGVCATVWAMLTGAPAGALIEFGTVGSTRSTRLRYRTPAGETRRSPGLSTPTIADDGHCATATATIDWRGRIARTRTGCH